MFVTQSDNGEDSFIFLTKKEEEEMYKNFLEN